MEKADWIAAASILVLFAVVAMIFDPRVELTPDQVQELTQECIKANMNAHYVKAKYSGNILRVYCAQRPPLGG